MLSVCALGGLGKWTVCTRRKTSGKVLKTRRLGNRRAENVVLHGKIEGRSKPKQTLGIKYERKNTGINTSQNEILKRIGDSSLVYVDYIHLQNHWTFKETKADYINEDHRRTETLIL